MKNYPIIIIGAGPAGLMAAQELAKKGYKVEVYEQNKAAARKFLVAGHGGFNLTHSEPLEQFITRYDRSELNNMLQSFSNQDTIDWLTHMGIPTYVGSSGKIFPTKEIKPIQVLNAWLNYLQKLGVQIHYGHRMVDFEEQTVLIEHQGVTTKKPFHKLILALGGGSWAKTGSDAKWVSLLKKKNIEIVPLQAANSGYNTTQDFTSLEGEVLKNINLSFQSTHKYGELVFTSYGIEGSAVYYMNRFTRKSVFPYHLYIDLKPQLSLEKIEEILLSKKKITELLKEKLKLNKTAIALLKTLDKETFNTPTSLAQTIKSFPIEVNSFRPIDEVISTAGGIDFKELNHDLSFKKYPNIICIGEMVDWEAPTGGYLLQACFSMGFYAARQIIEKAAQ